MHSKSLWKNYHFQIKTLRASKRRYSAPKITRTANILGMYFAFEISFSRLIFDIIKLITISVKAKPMQYMIMFNTAYEGLAELISNVIRDIRYPV